MCTPIQAAKVPKGISSRGYDAVSNSGSGTTSATAIGSPAPSIRTVSPVCWGIDDYGQASPPEGERFIALSSGERHVCALRADGTPVCWGDPAQGRTAPPEGEMFVAVSSGWAHTCALRADGTPICWGRDDFGQSLRADRRQVRRYRQRASAHLCAPR